MFTSLTSQQLPSGKYHQTRSRDIDILHYKAELTFDFNKLGISGVATMEITPLKAIDQFSLDAFKLGIKKISLSTSGGEQTLQFQNEGSLVEINLERTYSIEDTLTLTIEYTATPNAGMYFNKDHDHAGKYYVYTYGEGGLHSNWLPIYNDVNDKFSTEMVITVPSNYTAVSNGKLIEVTKSGKKTTFQWRQELPHSNYLISIYVGEFDRSDLPAAFNKIPLNFWVPKGKLKEGEFAFRNTTKMVEFFSKRFSYLYPWEKYDQIAIPDYSIGAMEHTSVTGHRSSVLRDNTAPASTTPKFKRYHDIWTVEGIVSHELAHHWFGNNVTCRNLSFIWLNESFATFCQFLWDQEYFGKNMYNQDLIEAFDRYLNYVNEKHIIRPLEYQFFDTPSDIYNEEHTYLKGALILNLLRNYLGDDIFFRALAGYLEQYEFSNVESSDFRITMEELTGENLSWFFDDWIYGAGHPVFEVSYDYFPNRNLIELTVQQVQPRVEGQDLFSIPVEIEVVVEREEEIYQIWIEKEIEHYLFDCNSKPLMVSFDGGRNIPAEIRFDKPIGELIYQIRNDDLPGQIRALRQITDHFPGRDETASIISEILSDPELFWGLKAAAARNLGSLNHSDVNNLIQIALSQPDYHIRKAVVLALADMDSKFAEKTLMQVIENDIQKDVVGTAIVALSKVNPERNIEYITKQIEQPSWYNEITIACLKAFENISDERNVPYIKKFTAERYNQFVREVALFAWKNSAPQDDELHSTLMKILDFAPFGVQLPAIELLGDLRVEKAKPVLENIVNNSGDIHFRNAASIALEKISRVESASF
jgi:aminopeptidase N